MRVLLVHPDDDPVKGLQQSGHWDRVVDLAGTSNGPGMERVPKLESADFGRIRDALAFGSGALIDSRGIDWWNLLSIEFHQWLEKLQVLRRLATEVDSTDEVFATRAGFEFEMLHAILGRELRYLSHPRGPRRTVRGRFKQLTRFRPEKIVEILGDKYDSGYRLRRLFSRRRAQIAGEVVLAPSSYVNASRGATAYASLVPEADFLLVATRACGLLKDVPRNMFSARLACYASPADGRDEMAGLLGAWRELDTRLAAHQDWGVLTRFGVLNGVPSLLRNGLCVRDAWLNVFESENIRAVLCGDEMNPFTRLPMCIAKQRGITALAFHHGALDGRYRYRDNSADFMLAKSEMEIDYLVKVCGVTEEKIALVPIENRQRRQTANHHPKCSIVFFSEPYEIVGGRCRDVYQQVLPGLRRLAREHGWELVLKLHPQENRPEREPIAAAAVGQGQFRIIDGPLESDLLGGVQFAVTVSSTAAIDCFERGIPAFVCSWLDRSHYGYGEHFVKFGFAIPLQSSGEVSAIPGIIAAHPAVTAEELGDCEMTAFRLRRLLDEVPAASAASGKLAEPAWA